MDMFQNKILSNKQRWNRALLFAIAGTLVSIIVCVFIQRALRIRTSLVYMVAGLFLGWLIMETGHGVAKKFSILAAVCTVVVILLSDIFVHYGIYTFSMLTDAFLVTLRSYLSVSLNNLLSLVLKIGAVSIAFERARVR